MQSNLVEFQEFLGLDKGQIGDHGLWNQMGGRSQGENGGKRRNVATIVHTARWERSNVEKGLVQWSDKTNNRQTSGSKWRQTWRQVAQTSRPRSAPKMQEHGTIMRWADFDEEAHEESKEEQEKEEAGEDEEKGEVEMREVE